ncbi:alpha/beta hydrolase [Desulfovibrio inopinatus]|uniref:alpha/beta hydrolase n=1 Tax=Desulfovibrio inopinatus TaxID=102109 RepID=UPI000409BC28|nr:alpha/beta hydrolase [Desulfovibrio inopinatus]
MNGILSFTGGGLLLGLGVWMFLRKRNRVDRGWIDRQWRDIAYATQSPAQRLDIYLPQTGDGPFPVVLSIHGGAFKFGDKADKQLTPMLQGLHRGYAVVSINYRLSGEAKWPAQIYDVKAAIRWIKAHAEIYHLDGNSIAAWGASAGGHLAALAGTSANVPDVEDKTMGNPEQSTDIQAVVDWFGPINFLTMDDHFVQSGLTGQKHSTPDSFESQLLGVPITERPDLVRHANPETYITSNIPPFLIQHGDLDSVVPMQQSKDFALTLQAIASEQNICFEILRGVHHADSAFDADPKNVARVFDFLDRFMIMT